MKIIPHNFLPIKPQENVKIEFSLYCYNKLNETVSFIKNETLFLIQVWWCTLVSPVTLGDKDRRILVPRPGRQKVSKTPC
jgi:hypothetical protein